MNSVNGVNNVNSAKSVKVMFVPVLAIPLYSQSMTRLNWTQCEQCEWCFLVTPSDPNLKHRTKEMTGASKGNACCHREVPDSQQSELKHSVNSSSVNSSIVQTQAQCELKHSVNSTNQMRSLQHRLYPKRFYSPEVLACIGQNNVGLGYLSA